MRGLAAPGRRQAVLLADLARAGELADEPLPSLRGQRNAVELMTYAGDAARVMAFERHGLRHRRSSFSMARRDSAEPLPAAAVPDAVEVAPYRRGDDDEAVHQLIYVDAAWGSVPGHVERDLNAWREKERPCRSMFLARAGRTPRSK